MKPVLQALVLAERIYQDVSGKKIIAGTFNQITIATREVPQPQAESGRRYIPGGSDPGCPAAYVSLTDVVDGTEITLQFVNMSENKVIFEVPLKIKCEDRLATVEVIVPLPPLWPMLTTSGTYSLDVVWRNEILGFHRISVVKTE